MQSLARRIQLRTTNAAAAVQDLSLQVRDIDHVEVHQPQRANPGGRKIERRRRSESAGANNEHSRRFQSALSIDTDGGQCQMPAVPL